MSARRRLPLFGRLDRYVALHFVSSYATALLLITGLFWIIDMASHLDDYLEPWDDGTVVSTGVVVHYYILHMPYLFLQSAPFVTLVAGMFTVNRLVKKNEVVAALGAGISAQRLLLPVFLGGVLAAAAMFALREWSGDRIAARREALHDMLDRKRLEQRYEALWLRDLSGSIVRLGTFLPGRGGAAGAEVEGLEAILRSADGVVVVNANRAAWNPATGRWELEEGVRRVMGQEKEESEVSELEGFEFTPRLALTYERARDNPLGLSMSEVQDLMRRDPDHVAYQTLWQYNLTFPLANLVLLLVGLPLMLSYERGGGAERMAAGGLLCLFYFGFDFVFRSLGTEGSLSPVLAGWLPILIFGSVGVVLVDSMRT